MYSYISAQISCFSTMPITPTFWNALLSLPRLTLYIFIQSQDPTLPFLEPVSSIYTIRKQGSFWKGSRLWNLTKKKNQLQDALCRQRSLPQQEAISSLLLPGAPHPFSSHRNWGLEPSLREWNQNKITKLHSTYTWSIRGGSCQRLSSEWKPVHP